MFMEWGCTCLEVLQYMYVCAHVGARVCVYVYDSLCRYIFSGYKI